MKATKSGNKNKLKKVPGFFPYKNLAAVIIRFFLEIIAKKIRKINQEFSLNQ